MKRIPVLFAAAMALAVFASPAAAQWKWKDRDGRIQYSDLPPPQAVPERDILQRPNAPTPARAPAAPADGAPAAAPSAAAAPAGAAPKGLEAEVEARRRKTEQDEAARKKAEDDKLAAAKAENCTRARGHLRALEDGLRMARTNAAGEREVLDDQQRAEETRRTRDIISADCR